MDVTLAQLLADLYMKDQALMQMAARIKELEAELEAATKPPAEPPSG